tara:strand:+ start:55 stop:1362 length:1308 start_codon:yes stop_codon:yes gene_type:complete
MAKTPDKFHINEVAQVYGSLNDVGISSDSPIANRRTIDTTLAVSEIVAQHFTPDVLKDKDEFLGVVLASIPSKIALLSAKSQQFEAHSSTFQVPGGKNQVIFYRYKVLIPELESRCLDLNDTIRPQVKSYGDVGSPLSMAQRINSMTDVSLDVSLYNTQEGVRAIQAGTLVKVEFEDLARMKGPKITAVFKKVFDFEATGTKESNAVKFSGRPKTLQHRARTRAIAERRDNLVTVPPAQPGTPGEYIETENATIVAPEKILDLMGIIYIFPHINKDTAIPSNRAFIPPLGKSTSYFAVFAKEGGHKKTSFKTIEQEVKAKLGERQPGLMSNYDLWPKKIYATGGGGYQVLGKDTDLSRFEQVILADPQVPNIQTKIVNNLIFVYNKENWKSISTKRRNRLDSLAKKNKDISTNYVEEVTTEHKQIAADVLSKITW